MFTDDQWKLFQTEGYVHLGQLLNNSELAAMQRRIDDIMLGRADVDYSRMLMQLDRASDNADEPGPQTKGHKGATLDYRKIQDLKFDPLFLAYMQRPIFRDICRRMYGDVSIASFRAMFMNKPAQKGTFLAWHQDRWTMLDRDPRVSVWTALDPATVANGCVQIIPRTHHTLINPSHDSGFLTPEQAEAHAPANKRVFLELKPGEAVLLHNWLLHGSDINHTNIPRRAFSVCYMDTRTRAKSGEKFSVVFGEGALVPPPGTPGEG
jgi:hypothetical protein